ncbi:DNA/RNA non-specific endonuclease [Xenorhabdus bovienii]
MPLYSPGRISANSAGLLLLALLNRYGSWRNMERTWADALKTGKTVDVKIQPRYSDNSARPSSFNVSYTVGKDRPIELNIKNTAEGK